MNCQNKTEQKKDEEINLMSVKNKMFEFEKMKKKRLKKVPDAIYQLGKILISIIIRKRKILIISIFLIIRIAKCSM